MTALMLASSKGHLDAVQALQRGGADLNKEHPVSLLHMPQPILINLRIGEWLDCPLLCCRNRER